MFRNGRSNRTPSITFSAAHAGKAIDAAALGEAHENSLGLIFLLVGQHKVADAVTATGFDQQADNAPCARRYECV